MQAPYILKSSSSEVTWLSLLLAHYQARHVTALHTSQSLSQYGNLPLLKLEGPLLRHFGRWLLSCASPARGSEISMNFTTSVSF